MVYAQLITFPPDRCVTWFDRRCARCRDEARQDANLLQLVADIVDACRCAAVLLNVNRHEQLSPCRLPRTVMPWLRPAGRALPMRRPYQLSMQYCQYARASNCGCGTPAPAACCHRPRPPPTPSSGLEADLSDAIVAGRARSFPVVP